MKRFFCCGTRQKKEISFSKLVKRKHLPQNPTWSLDEVQNALSTSSFKIVSNEILLQIFGYLSVQDLANVSLVCRSFKIFADHDQIWKPKCSMSKKLYSKSFKQIYVDRILEKSSLDEKYQLLDDFCMHTSSGNIIRPRHSRFQLERIDDRAWKYRKTSNSTPSNELESNERFGQHPNSSPTMTIKLLVNIDRTALELIRLLEKASLSREQWQDTVILKQMIQRYYHFLQLKSSQPANLFLVPTIDIEMIWQSHLLRPEMYRNDCLRLFDQVIDHSLILNPKEQAFKEQAFLDTCQLYEQQFGQEYCSLRSSKRKKKFSFKSFDEKDQLLDTSAITYSYWDKTSFYFSSEQPIDYENPFSFSEDDIIRDGKWFETFQQFLSHTFDQVVSKEITTIDLKHQALDKFKKSYEKFLYMIAKYSLTDENGLIPSTHAIEIIWYSHLQEPFNYTADCIRLLGFTIFHNPRAIIDNQTTKESNQKIQQIWKEEFQCDMSTDHLYDITNHQQ